MSIRQKYPTKELIIIQIPYAVIPKWWTTKGDKNSPIANEMK